MMKICFEYKFLLFLSAYLRQIDLSLDRSRWTEWVKLREYYSNKLKPDAIVNYIVRYSKVEIDYIEFPWEFERYGSLTRLKLLGKRMLSRRPCLESVEVVRCCSLLLKFDQYLRTDFDCYDIEIEKLRIGIAKFNTNVVEVRIKLKDLHRVRGVEHYLQNAGLTVTKMAEFTVDIC